MSIKGMLVSFQNLRFKYKLFSSYLVVSIIPLIVLGTFSYVQANQFLLQQANQNLTSSMNQATETIHFRTKQYEAIINSITQNVVFKQIFIKHNGDFPGLYRDYVDPFFSNILDFNPDILQLSVFTENKELLRGEYILPMELTHDLQWTPGKQAGATEWLGRNGKVFITRAFEDPDTGPRQETPSVLFLSVDADSLFQGLADIGGQAFGILILDEGQQPIYSQQANLPQSAKEISSTVSALLEPSGTFRSASKEYMYLRNEIGQTGWNVVYFTPREGITVDASNIVRATVLITAICFAILVFIIWMFSTSFVKRITGLNKTMMQVESGNLKIDISSTSKDEIGQLTNRFARMLANINRLIEEVYQSKIIQKEAELKALQTQINPHFLYNTLSIINWKALEIDAMEISEVTTTVSKFYRTVLNKGKSTISVRNELENARAYMYIQLIMHDHSFDFECDVAEELQRFDMLNLIFQPILENALEHGIDQLRKGSRRGRIELRGRRSEGKVQFTIEDNGPGMSPELASELLQRSTKGYGLKNVHDRIQILFGAPYGLTIESRLGEGTLVTITLPEYTEPVQVS
jgi:two-component system, sensor histidine kinase YesM